MADGATMLSEVKENHPADQLMRVRLAIKSLEEEAEGLRQAILAMPEEDRAGRYYVAQVRTGKRKTVDAAAVRELVEQGLVPASVLVERETQTLALEALEGEW